MRCGSVTRSVVGPALGRRRCTRCFDTWSGLASPGHLGCSVSTSTSGRCCRSSRATPWVLPGPGRRGSTLTTTLVQVADWLRSYHAAVADFEPPVDASWREGGRWRPGLIVGHNDAAPYNAAWDDAGRLRGLFDWDLAAPVSLEWDLAFTAFAWVPLHARHVVEAEGFAAFDQRPRRLRLFLQRYGWEGDTATFLRTVGARVLASAEGIERTASRGDLAYQQMLEAGVAESLRTAAAELARDSADLACL